MSERRRQPMGIERATIRLLHMVGLLGVISVAQNRLATATDATDGVAPPVESVRSEFKLAPFYEKCVMAGGLPIVSSNKVHDAALHEAADIVRNMLRGRDDLLQALFRNKVRIAIMAPTEFTTDIPEHSDLTPAKYWNRRARGLGATNQRLATSCGEENLLGLPGDPYREENILVHEFAHSIHLMALVDVDPTFDRRLKSAFESAKRTGLWRGKYAGTFHTEYWAEGVQTWFGTNRVNDHDHNDVCSRGQLREYDPELVILLEEVFGDNDWSYLPPCLRPTAPHLAGWQRPAELRFVWPAELKGALEFKPQR